MFCDNLLYIFAFRHIAYWILGIEGNVLCSIILKFSKGMVVAVFSRMKCKLSIVKFMFAERPIRLRNNAFRDAAMLRNDSRQSSVPLGGESSDVQVGLLCQSRPA